MSREREIRGYYDAQENYEYLMDLVKQCVREVGEPANAPDVLKAMKMKGVWREVGSAMLWEMIRNGALVRDENYRVKVVSGE